MAKVVRLSSPQLQISPVERDLERGSPLLSSTSQVSDLATDRLGLASHLEPGLLLLVVSLGKSQEERVGEVTPQLQLLVCRAANPEYQQN